MGNNASVLGSWLHLARNRPLGFFAGAFVVALVLALVEYSIGDRLGRLAEPGRGAKWIWAEGVSTDSDPTSFWALRDFELDSVGAARVVIVADEEYVFWINGVRAGSGAYRRDVAADQYRLDQLLQPGWNRWIIEARSSRGAGGLLASLRLDGEDQPTIATDKSWRIVRPDPRWLAGLGHAREAGQPPRIWSRPPTGRWRPAPANGLRPTLDLALGLTPATSHDMPPTPPSLGQRPPQADRLQAPPQALARPRLLSFADPEADPSWEEIPRGELPGGMVIYDFGTVVEGYLQLMPALPKKGSTRAETKAGKKVGHTGHPLRASSVESTETEYPPALLYTGVELPVPQERRPDTVVQLRRGFLWYDSIPRRFRYVALVGAPSLDLLQARLPAAADLVALRTPPRDPDGAFGLQPAKDYTPAEEAVWDRLAGRESTLENTDDSTDR